MPAQLNPNYRQEYNRVAAEGDTRTFDEWLRAHVSATNSNDPEALAYLGLDRPEVQSESGGLNIDGLIENAAGAGAVRATAEGGNTNQVQYGTQTGEYDSSGSTNQTNTKRVRDQHRRTIDG